MSLICLAMSQFYSLSLKRNFYLFHTESYYNVVENSVQMAVKSHMFSLALFQI